MEGVGGQDFSKEAVYRQARDLQMLLGKRIPFLTWP